MIQVSQSVGRNHQKSSGLVWGQKLWERDGIQAMKKNNIVDDDQGEKECMGSKEKGERERER